MHLLYAINAPYYLYNFTSDSEESLFSISFHRYILSFLHFFWYIKMICYSVMKMWFCRLCFWVSVDSGFLLELMKKITTALVTCIFALGGAAIGAVTGGIKGQTTETGLLRGIMIGLVTGAITAIQLLELIVNGEPFSKVALICSLLNGKVFMEWVSPALLKAYQWQVISMETSIMEISDIFDVTVNKGLSQDMIQKLPSHTFHSSERNLQSEEMSCAICLQDFTDGECAKMLPRCGHSFHPRCIDDWLIRQGNCPLCRNEV